jgi:predicted transporter
VLFVAIAMLSGHLIKLLEPVLRKGPYLHALMAIGMIGWGIYLLKSQKTGIRNQESRVKSQKTEHRGQKTEDRSSGLSNVKAKIQKNNSELSTLNSLLLLIPCPVCLSAMTFSTWAALNVFKFPAYLVGLGLGIVFIVLSLAFYFSLKLFNSHSSLVTPRVGLGLSMIAIGFYFIASLYLPAKIEEAKGAYKSFITEGNGLSLNDSIGVFIVLAVAMLIGYMANKKRDRSSCHSRAGGNPGFKG